jgi:N-hydroxyarylamine O-acetyltransferase
VSNRSTSDDGGFAVQSPTVFDLDAYLARIGLSGRPGIAEVHRAHATTIPFENLDPHRGVPVSLAIDDLERKLVHDRRGGYCFEQNLLLATALEALGLEVDLMLARVRVGGVVRPPSHLVVRAADGGDAWHVDAGFGRGTLLEPIPFGPGGEHEQSGWRFRVVQDGPEYVLQAASESGWADQYGFVPEPVPRIDIEVQNWFTSTHPRSPFVTGLIASRYRDDGSLVALTDWDGSVALSDSDGLVLTEATAAASTATPVARAAIPELLSELFGLDGFALGADGRVVVAGVP